MSRERMLNDFHLALQYNIALYNFARASIEMSHVVNDNSRMGRRPFLVSLWYGVKYHFYVDIYKNMQ